MIIPATMPIVDFENWLSIIFFVEDSVDENGLDENDPDEDGLEDKSAK